MFINSHEYSKYFFKKAGSDNQICCFQQCRADSESGIIQCNLVFEFSRLVTPVPAIEGRTILKIQLLGADYGCSEELTWLCLSWHLIPLLPLGEKMVLAEALHHHNNLYQS